MYEIDDLAGRRYNRLTVLSDSGERTSRREVKWICICDCGNRISVNGYKLKSGHTKSCGCLLRERVRETRALPDACIRQMYCKYRENAKKRNLSFDLSIQTFKELVTRNCYYCNSSPNERFFVPNGLPTTSRANGVDRKDNSLGYTVENCVPCCTSCNKAKLDRTQVEFIDWVKRVYEHSCGS